MHEDDMKLLEQEILSQEPVEAAAAEEESMDVVPHYTHSLMDILLPAHPPKPVNARVIRRLKD